MICFVMLLLSSLEMPKIEIKHLETAESCTHEVCINYRSYKVKSLKMLMINLAY